MLLLLEGELDVDSLDKATKMSFKIYTSKNGRKIEVKDDNLIRRYLRDFTHLTCDCEFSHPICYKDRNEVLLSDKDKKGLDDLCNQCTDEGFVYMSIRC